MSNIIEHPFRVSKSGPNEYYVYNEDTMEIWRYFNTESDACRFAYDANGNTGELSREKRGFFRRLFRR